MIEADRAPAPTLLDETAEKIRSLLVADASNSLENQLEIGRSVERIRMAAGYGDAAVPKLAAKLEVSPKLLHRLAARVVAFEREVLEDAIRWSREIKHPLTGHHLDILASVGADAERLRLLDRVLRERLSARKLGREVRGEPQTTRASHGASLSTVVARAEAVCDALESVRDAWVGGAYTDDTPRALEALERLGRLVKAVAEDLVASAGQGPGRAEDTGRALAGAPNVLGTNRYADSRNERPEGLLARQLPRAAKVADTSGIRVTAPDAYSGEHQEGASHAR